MKKNKPKRFWIYYNSFKIGDGFCVEEFGRHVNPKGYCFNETRANNILQIVTKGICHLTVINGGTEEKITLKEGDAFLIKSGVKHTYVADNDFPCTRVWLAFIGSSVSNIFKMLNVDGGYAIFSDLNINGIEEIFSNLSENKNNSNVAKFNVLSYVNRLFAILAEKLNETNSIDSDKNSVKETKELVDTVVKYIDVHIKEKLQVEDISRLFNYEMSYFYKLFKQYTGVSVQQYVIERKMHFARELCVETDMPFIEIAYNLGYSNYVAFYKAFVKIVHASPQKYRQTYQKNK